MRPYFPNGNYNYGPYVGYGPSPSALLPLMGVADAGQVVMGGPPNTGLDGFANSGFNQGPSIPPMPQSGLDWDALIGMLLQCRMAREERQAQLCRQQNDMLQGLFQAMMLMRLYQQADGDSGSSSDSSITPASVSGSSRKAAPERPESREELPPLKGAMTPNQAWELIKAGRINEVRKAKMSRYYTWGDFFSDRTHENINNYLKPDYLNNGLQLARSLDKVSDDFGRKVPVESWWRDPDSNRRVGGKSESKHMVGIAMDPDVSALDAGEYARLLSIVKNYPEFNGIGSGGGKLHFDIREGPRVQWRYPEKGTATA